MNEMGLGERMKKYEGVSGSTLMLRTPVIVRVDGKAFSRLTSRLERPFDQRIIACMTAAAMRMATETQNCRMVYHQSDEISLLLTDFKTLTTEPWLGNDVQKIASIAAAMATAGFIEAYMKHFPDALERGSLPVFDGRCFNMPREDVANYFVWRQRDAERNSVSMAARAHFSHKEVLGMNRAQMMDMLMLRKGVNWNDYDPHFKRGSIIVRAPVETPTSAATGVVRSRWTVQPAPVFTQDRSLIESFMREDQTVVDAIVG